MSAGLHTSRLAPWTGWWAGALAWALHHQAGSDLAFGRTDCHTGAPQIGLGLACALVALVGACVSWSSRNGPLRSSAFNTRMFVCLVGGMASAIFLMGILFQTFAGLIVPPCFAG